MPVMSCAKWAQLYNRHLHTNSTTCAMQIYLSYPPYKPEDLQILRGPRTKINYKHIITQYIVFVKHFFDKFLYML